MSMSKSPLMIGISGGTGSGKTTVSQKILAAFDAKHMIVLEHDAYYKDLSSLPLHERAKVNFDHPDALDNEHFIEQLKMLKRGEVIQKPVYSFEMHSREKYTERIRPGDAVIVEGILLFALAEVRELLDIKIFVETDDDIRLIRRIVRDINQRGRSLDNVIDQYQRTVRPMHFSFVEPTKRYADIIIPSGGKNDVAIAWVVAAIRERISNR